MALGDLRPHAEALGLHLRDEGRELLDDPARVDAHARDAFDLESYFMEILLPRADEFVEWQTGNKARDVRNDPWLGKLAAHLRP